MRFHIFARPEPFEQTNSINRATRPGNSDDYFHCTPPLRTDLIAIPSSVPLAEQNHPKIGCFFELPDGIIAAAAWAPKRRPQRCPKGYPPRIIAWSVPAKSSSECEKN